MRLVVNKNSKYEKNYSIFQMQKQFKTPKTKQTKKLCGRNVFCFHYFHTVNFLTQCSTKQRTYTQLDIYIRYDLLSFISLC